MDTTHTNFTGAAASPSSLFFDGETPDPYLPGKGDEAVTLFAIYRHEKHKNAGTVAVAANHMTRESDTPNADPGRAHLNRVFIGTADPAADVAALVPPRNALNDQGHKVRRSNSVIAIEILLTTSPGQAQGHTGAAARLGGPLDRLAGARIWPREYRAPAPSRRRADASPDRFHRSDRPRHRAIELASMDWRERTVRQAADRLRGHRGSSRPLARHRGKHGQA